MYISKRKKDRQAGRNAVDEFFANGYVKTQSIDVLVSASKKHLKFLESYYAAREAQYFSENKDKKIVG